MKQLQIDLQGPENFRTVVSLMSFSMSASTKQSKSQYLSLGSQNLDAIYRTSCPSTQDITSSLHMFCCHVLNGLPTCLQVMLHAKLAMTGAGQNFNLSVCHPLSVDCIRQEIFLIISVSMAAGMDAVSHMTLAYAGNLELFFFLLQVNLPYFISGRALKCLSPSMPCIL